MLPLILITLKWDNAASGFDWAVTMIPVWQLVSTLSKIPALHNLAPLHTCPHPRSHRQADSVANLVRASRGRDVSSIAVFGPCKLVNWGCLASAAVSSHNGSYLNRHLGLKRS